MEIQLNGTHIYYREWGHGARAVLCFHGWAMDGESWMPLARHFPPQDWRVIVPDLRGFGRSDKPPRGYHIDDYLRDAVRLLRALNLKQVYALGHSFGGTGALYMACRIPHLIGRLILFDTIPGAANARVDPRVKTQFARIQALARKAPDTALPHLLTRIWRQSLTGELGAQQIAAQAEASRQAERHAVLATLDTILTTDIGDWLARLKVPTVVFRGAQDPVLRDGPDGLEGLPNATRLIVPHAGHYPPIENPEGVWPHVAEFFGADP